MASKIVITCAPRVTPYLEQELKALDFKCDKVNRLSIETTGNINHCLLLNLHLRTANKVLLHIKTFEAHNPDQLYKAIYDIDWTIYIPSNGYISVNGYAKNDFIKDTRFANLKTKDAIVDRINKETGRRPDSGPDQSKAMIYLHWSNETASIYLDTSGETIAKHGYRKNPHKAPMLESLAAATLMASRWDKRSHVVNPMCGSGTVAIEAALMATNTAPGLLRTNFAFMHFNHFDQAFWQKIKSEANRQIKETLPFRIIASDISRRALMAAQQNAKMARVEHLIEFEQGDFKKSEVPKDNPGIVFFNPEYGLRLGEEEELENVYSEIGDFFKNSCQGYLGYIFTGNMNLAKKVGLKAARRIEFYNAKIDARLLEYEIYSGTKK